MPRALQDDAGDVCAPDKANGVMPAPYAARFHWVAVTDAEKLPRAALQELIEESYHLVAAKLPRKVRKKLGMEPP